jgi:dimethylargininase
MDRAVTSRPPEYFRRAARLPPLRSAFAGGDIPPVDTPSIALIRRPPRGYPKFYAAHGVTIDIALADWQHAAYVDALRAAGLDIQFVAPDEHFADGVFIEDTAVVWQGRALRTRMAPHREGEQDAVIGHLGQTHEIVTLPPTATLDGGDVLHTEDVTYVGRSSRTNAAGVRALRQFLAPSKRRVIEVPVERCLHLKSAATWLGDETLLVAHDLVDVSYFEIERVLFTAEGEEKVANTLRIGSHLLVLAGYPATAATFWEFAQYRGLTLHALEMSEFEKGDGSLTCLAILV